MISIELLRKLLLDNRRLVESKKVFARQIPIGKSRRHLLYGVRGSGKSHLLYRAMQRLLAEGKSWDDMLYLNFEDDRLMDFTAKDFDIALLVHREMTGSAKLPILFFDEIQLVNGWIEFVRRMVEADGQIRIATSNFDVMYLAVGQGFKFSRIPVFPLSFPEVLDIKGVPYDYDSMTSTAGQGMILHAFRDYLQFGGFPEVVDANSKPEALNEIYKNAYQLDVGVRHKMTDLMPFRMMMKILAENIGRPFTYPALARCVTFRGYEMSHNDCIGLAGHARDAGLLLPVGNIVDQPEYEETVKKFYFVDNGLVSLLGAATPAALLENLVAVTLLRRHTGFERVFFYQRNAEIDFYVPEVETAVDVCEKLNSAPETMAREIRAFERLSKEFSVTRRVIVTLEEEGTLDSKVGPIEVIPACKFLLQ